MTALCLRFAVFGAVLTLTVGPVWGDSPPQELADPGVVQSSTEQQLAAWVLEANPGLAAIQTAADRNVDALRLRAVAQPQSAYAESRFVDSALDTHHATQALLDLARADYTRCLAELKLCAGGPLNRLLQTKAGERQ